MSALEETEKLENFDAFCDHVHPSMRRLLRHGGPKVRCVSDWGTTSLQP
jgi:hypothetical protein